MNIKQETRSGTRPSTYQGERKDGRGNEPIGSCATCDIFVLQNMEVDSYM